MSATEIDIFSSGYGDLPAKVYRPKINTVSQREYLALILANIASLIGATKLTKVVAAALFTRPADTTAYGSGDLVANSTTAGSVVPISFAAGRINGGTVQIRRARLVKSNVVVTNAAFYLHLFTISPTVTNGDNGAIVPLVSGYVGTLSVASMIAGTAAAVGVGAPLVGTEITATLAAGSKTLYGLLEARGAYTPASGETFTATLELLQS